MDVGRTGNWFETNSSSKVGDMVLCKRCGTRFTRPTWFFEGLCDPCFSLFDADKMKGRFHQGPPCENSDEWMSFYGRRLNDNKTS
jgi:hypothetical protein